MAGTPCIVVKGIVLRETETREADKILTLLTGEYGKLSVIARGARRKSCKFAACAQSLAWSEWQDLDAMALGFYFAELTEAVTTEDSPSEELLRHLLNGLYALSALHKPPALAKPAFELKLLCLAGYEPLADACAYCGAEEPENPVLDAAQGILRCGGCGGPGMAAPLCRDSLAALRHIVYGDPKRLYAFTLGPEPMARLGRAAEVFLFAQLERKFRTLDFYKSLQTPETLSK